MIKKQHKKKDVKKSNLKIKIIKIMFKNHKNDIKIFNSPINCKRDGFIHASLCYNICMLIVKEVKA